MLRGVPPGNVTLLFAGSGVNAGLPLGAVADGQQITISVTVSDSNATLDSSQAASGSQMEIEGVIGGLSGACPTLAFTISGKTIKTNASTRFDGAPCPNVLSGDRAEVGGIVQSDGTVLATKVEVNKGDQDKEAELKGTISGLSGACPAVTFSLGGKVVKTNAATRFNDGACARLANGMQAEAEGTIQGDGSLLATKVQVDLEDGGDEGGDQDAEAEGQISGLSGTCPNLTFSIGSRAVQTTGSTQFKGVTCGALANGTEVEVKGTLTGGVLAATRVERQ